LSKYPLKLAEIVSWYRSKQSSLAGSAAKLIAVRERTEYTPAAAADFDGPNTMGQILGWVSSEFDFQVLQVSDGKNIFSKHVDVSSVDEFGASARNPS
jgi:hypothetical protein